MKIIIINVVNLNNNGIEVGQEDNPGAVRYFDDNGGLPDGNYSESDIEGNWAHIEGRHEVGTYAYRQIDDSTLVKLNSLDVENDPGIRRKFIEQLQGETFVEDAEWFERNDPEMLDWIVSSKYWGRGFEETPARSEAVIEILFDEGGARYYATFESHPDGVRQSLNNQPAWDEDSWEDWGDIRQLATYYKELS